MSQSINPYVSLGQNIFDGINDHLETRLVKGLTLHNFFEQRIKIKDFYTKIVTLRANAVQKHHQETKERYIKEGRTPHFLLLKYRRGGLTTWEQSTSYRMIATQRNTTCLTLADTKDNTTAIFRMVKLMRDLDPKCPICPPGSKSHIEFPSLNTIFRIGTAGAKALSRGDTLNRVHGSEVAWWNGDYDVIDNLSAGLTEAARFGEVVYETTANGAEGWFYEKYCEAMKGENTWIPLFYPWFIDPINYIEPTNETMTEFLDTQTEEELALMEMHDLSIGQMLWRRQKKFQLKKLFNQEYPEDWTKAFLVRGLTFFDAEMLDRHLGRCKQPLPESTETLTVWERPIAGEDYCAGADVGEGNDDSDASVCGIMHKKSGRQVAVLRGKWRPEVFARKSIALCKRYNYALFGCEVNNHGHSVMNTVVNTLRYKHLMYREKPLDKNKYGKNKVEKVPGWLTNAKTRPILLDELNEALEENYLLVNDKIFISEAKTFVDKGGRYEADTGQHDDSIMAWGIAWQCRKQKKKTYISV